MNRSVGVVSPVRYPCWALSPNCMGTWVRRGAASLLVSLLAFSSECNQIFQYWHPFPKLLPFSSPTSITTTAPVTSCQLPVTHKLFTSKYCNSCISSHTSHSQSTNHTSPHLGHSPSSTASSLCPWRSPSVSTCSRRDEEKGTPVHIHSCWSCHWKLQYIIKVAYLATDSLYFGEVHILLRFSSAADIFAWAGRVKSWSKSEKGKRKKEVVIFVFLLLVHFFSIHSIFNRFCMWMDLLGWE